MSGTRTDCRASSSRDSSKASCVTERTASSDSGSDRGSREACVCVYKYVRWGRERREAHGDQGVGGTEGLLELYPGVQKGIPDDLKRRCYQMACGKSSRRGQEDVPFDGISRGLYGDLALSLPEERQQEH